MLLGMLVLLFHRARGFGNALWLGERTGFRIDESAEMKVGKL